MIISKKSDDQFQIILSRIEIIAINNCINDVRTEIYIEEFETKIGLDEETVGTIHRQILTALRGQE
jgi:hypothetical protein